MPILSDVARSLHDMAPGLRVPMNAWETSLVALAALPGIVLVLYCLLARPRPGSWGTARLTRQHVAIAGALVVAFGLWSAVLIPVRRHAEARIDPSLMIKRAQAALACQGIVDAYKKAPASVLDISEDMRADIVSVCGRKLASRILWSSQLADNPGAR